MDQPSSIRKVVGDAALCAALLLFPVGLSAQAAPDEKKGLEEKSEQELAQELLRYLDAVEDDMGHLEQEIRKSSQPTLRPDQRYANLKALADKIRRGELKELPAWLQEYLKTHPEVLAEILGMSPSDAAELLDDPRRLLEKLGASDEWLGRLVANEDAFREVIEIQTKTEDSMRELLERQAKLGKNAKEGIEGALDHAYELRRRASGGS